MDQLRLPAVKVQIMSYKIPMQIRLTPKSKVLLEEMAEESGLTKTAMIELLIREGAKKRKASISHKEI